MPYTTQSPEMEQYILDHFNEALTRGYITVYCQPVIRVASGQICGLEALARWNDPEMGLLMPNSFIGVLEKHRRIHELDTYVVCKVCDEILPSMADDAFVPVSVNLSRLDYELCDVFEIVEKSVRANKLPRSSLCIEITESVLGGGNDVMRGYVERFRAAGYSVWMDDFGSGYSSLNVLKDYPFDELKIDMEFLSDFGMRSKKILSAIIHMAKEIGIQTLTEGVETREQMEFLRNIGCEKVQGHLFGRAMPFDELLRFAQERSMQWESPRYRKYYDDLGKLNVLSATPFVLGAQEDPESGRSLNSIPIAVLELRGDGVSFLYANRSFEDTAKGVDWNRLFEAETDPSSGGGGAVRMDALSGSLRRLLLETREEGGGSLNFVYNEEYFEISTKRLARYGDRCAILACVLNLSEAAELARQGALDGGLRQLYSVYERVSLLDLEKGTVEVLYLDSQNDKKFPKRPVKEAMQLYAEKCVFPEDRARFLRFADADTLAYRVERLGEGIITGYFRTLGLHGAYSWKCHTVIHVRDNVFYNLIRDTEAEIHELESYYRFAGGETGQSGIPLEILWENVKRNSPLKFFWKDKERRFLGVSQSFLDFYGFSSLEDVIGKTDEDMGWHIHPDEYRNCEWEVLNEGAASVNKPGSCIVHGENRNIVASKMPLHSPDGEIIGLIGYFDEADSGRGGAREKPGHARVDRLTGLSNSRGLDEDMYAFRDEYELRGTDFVRIDVCMEEMGDLNRRYGYDFGDGVLRAVARALLRCCGSTSTVGRLTGTEFVVFAQVEDAAEAAALAGRIRAISDEQQTVDGVPFTTYLSVGTSLYSETENLEKQMFQSRMRRMTDDVERIPQRHLRENMEQVFYLYETLPVAYAVYKVLEEDGKTDAVILYVNDHYTKLTGMNRERLVGERVERAFPMQTDAWWDAARRASAGETVTETTFYGYVGLHMTMTASQVIGPGFCAFTYQEADPRHAGFDE